MSAGVGGVAGRMKQGQVIVRNDLDEARQLVAGGEAQVAQTEATLANARAAVERNRQLAAQKFISQTALDKAEADFRVAEVQLKAARGSAAQAVTRKSYIVVVSPYSGVVSVRHVELGERAAPGKPLMTGFDPADMRVIATVPQYKIAEVRAGSPAMVEIPSLNKWIQARAIIVLPTADTRTHATFVRLDLPPNLRDVYPGMFARRISAWPRGQDGHAGGRGQAQRTDWRPCRERKKSGEPAPGAPRRAHGTG